MNGTKAAFTVLALAVGLVWAGGTEMLPLPGALQDLAIGIIGTVGLALGSVFRAFAAVALPLAGILRVLAVPLSLGLIGWLIARELTRARG